MSESRLPVDNAKAFMQSAFSLLSSSNSSQTSSTTSKPSEKSPEDIPKEELVHLCMKMNKRMQAMELKGQELIKKKNSLASDKKVLIEFLRSIPLQFHFQDDLEILPSTLNESWGQYLAQQSEYVNNLATKLALAEQALSQLEIKHRDGLHQMQVNSSTASEFPSTAPQYNDEVSLLISEKNSYLSTISDLNSKISKLEIELETKKAIETSLKNNLSQLENSIESKNLKLEELQKLLDSSKAQYEERLLYLQMQQNNWKTKEDALIRENQDFKKMLGVQSSQISSLQLKLEEREIALKTGKEVNQALQTKLISIESETSSLREKYKEVEKQLSLALTAIKEKDETFQSMNKDLRIVSDLKEDIAKQTKEIEEYRTKIDAMSNKITSQSDHIKILSSDLEDKVSLVTRLRSEAQANERNHAMRTAMLATCEAQLDSINAELVSKTEALKEANERVSNLQVRMSSSESRFEERLNELNCVISKLESDLVEQRNKFDKEIFELKNSYELTLEDSRKEFAKKSSLARSLISEKEEENRLILMKVQELQAEISSGAPSERKIFELAQLQAKRETSQGLHNDTREIAFNKVLASLAERDLELARLQQMHSETILEIAELKRVSRRETVNMDYLKNIILQYMTFPLHAPERMSLIPVISTLLQFNPKEMVEVEKSSKDPAWSSRPVKEIKRSLHRAASISNSQHGSDSPRLSSTSDTIYKNIAN